LQSTCPSASPRFGGWRGCTRFLLDQDCPFWSLFHGRFFLTITMLAAIHIIPVRRLPPPLRLVTVLLFVAIMVMAMVTAMVMVMAAVMMLVLVVILIIIVSIAFLFCSCSLLGARVCVFVCERVRVRARVKRRKAGPTPPFGAHGTWNLAGRVCVLRRKARFTPPVRVHGIRIRLHICRVPVCVCVQCRSAGLGSQRIAQADRM